VGGIMQYYIKSSLDGNIGLAGFKKNEGKSLVKLFADKPFHPAP
jgi:hypothetical protein